ncbi:tripartite ATP-independent transporter DctP family solute receptor [Pasteurella langaaensis DSM 22999]|uniref:Tripartite ATP-independent transporter DctP family solute receptor n=1 Tax=Alitibacter langaaensis DSM 22999 TaxID=1122935 RepID=A0A2U0T7Y8_9PAST|nr:TRAP transporter substrate-binding protein [Pasteurella langaaensis]PVX39709.1 tripartite ATP-independent transporter DctP family solute receptor [Pasteurella langaaensis DSM 22999]
MKINKLLLSSLCIALPMLSVSTNALAQKVTLKLAHNLDQTHVVHQALAKMAKEVQEKSNGELKIRIYPSGQMGGPRETIELIQNDALDMTKASASEMESFVKEFSIFSSPYLFDNEEHFKKVLFGEVGKEITDKTQASGFNVLASYVAGTRSFYAKKPIHSPADMKGLKIRVVSTPTTNKLIELLGGSPAPIPFGEVYTALQQGVIDGAENNIPSYNQTRHVEVAKYYIEDQHTSVPDYLIISSKTWAKLDDNQRKILTEAAKNSEIIQQQLWDDEVKKSRAEAEKVGATFISVNKEPFRNALKPLYDDFAKDPDLATLIEKIKATANESIIEHPFK